jgi:hypothetical protein
MDAVSTLPKIGKIYPALYLPCGPHADLSLIAVGMASIFPPPVRVFAVKSDVLTPEEGQELAQALTSSSAVVVFGSSESKLIQDLGHYWPDYVEHPSYCSIARHVDLTPSRNQDALASVYLLIPQLTAAHRSDRPGQFRISPEDAQIFVSRANCSEVSVESLGQVAAGISTNISMRELCLLHERDTQDAVLQRHSWHEIVTGSAALSWTDLQTVLRHSPQHDMLEHFRPRLTPEKYAYGRLASDAIRSFKEQMQGDVFPDIYSAVWTMEHVFQPGTMFRGQFLSQWGLESSLLRPPRGCATLDVGEIMKRIRCTSRFLAAVKQREGELFGEQMDEHSLLAIAQHFGFPTPLLDFTKSFKIAAFFATLGAAGLNSGDTPIGVIFYNTAPLEKQLALDEQTHSRGLHQLAGIRIGSLHVIRPNLPDADDRIRRQQGVFIAGYRARDLQAVSIDRVYFRQQPGVTFQDPKAGISSGILLPENTAVSELAAEVRRQAATESASGSSLLDQTAISDSSVIGSAGAHLYWHLRFGQQLLGDLRRQAEQIDAKPLSQALEAAVGQYFDFAHVEATISQIPDHEQDGARLVPIRKTIAALESAAGLPEDQIWRLLSDQLPQGFAAGGVIQFPVPSDWPPRARLALSCALFCMAWEHLRHVPGLRAQELVQSATMHLHSL